MSAGKRTGVHPSAQKQYARNGRKIKDESLREYFNQFAWYEPAIEPYDFNDQTMLSELERKNLD